MVAYLGGIHPREKFKSLEFFGKTNIFVFFTAKSANVRFHAVVIGTVTYTSGVTAAE